LGWAEAKAAHGHPSNAAGCTDPSAINARVRDLGKGMSAGRTRGFFPPANGPHPRGCGSRRCSTFARQRRSERAPARGLFLLLPLHYHGLATEPQNLWPGLDQRQV